MLVPLKISPKDVQSFNYSLNKAFNIKQGYVECGVEFRPIQTSRLDTLSIYLVYKYSISSFDKDSDVKLEAEFVQLFELTPISYILPEGIYKCVGYCSDRLKKSLNSILDTDDFSVSTPPFEGLEERLKAIVLSARNGDFGLSQ